MMDALSYAMTWLAAVYWLISIALLFLSSVAAIAQPWIAARRGTRRDRPPVSIVLPVKLLDANFEGTQESALTQDYPCFDVTVSAVDMASPAVALMREIFNRYPNVSARILHSTAQFAVSPKVDNLFAPFIEAKNDVVFMKDANVHLEPDALAEHMKQLTDDVGLVCGIPYCVGLHNFAAHVEAAIINGPHARVLFLASAFGQVRGIGKIMLFRKSDFLSAGGFGAIAHTVVEDNAMAKAMKRIGKRVVFSHRPVCQELGARVFRDVYQRQLRWSVGRRCDEFLLFLAEPLTQSIPSIAAGALAAPLVGLSAVGAAVVTLGIWFATETLLSFAKGWQPALLVPTVFLAREATMLIVWVKAWTTDRVVWARNTVNTRASATPAPVARKER